MREYYVYAYLDPRKEGEYIYGDIKFEYEPFHIGKGKGRRIYMGISESKKDYHKNRKIKKIISDGFFPVLLKLKEDLNEEEAFDEEIRLIKLIGRNDLGKGSLTNLTDGGGGTTNITPEWKKVLSKPVIQFKDGIQIDEYVSVKEAAEKTGLIKQNISSCLTGKYKTTGGFSWKYKNEKDLLQGHIKKANEMPKHSEYTKLKMSQSAKKGSDHPQKKRMGKNSSLAKKIVQKDMEGNIIKIWDSMMDITRELKFTASNICRCCKGDVKRIGGFKWEYYL